MRRNFHRFSNLLFDPIANTWNKQTPKVRRTSTTSPTENSAVNFLGAREERRSRPALPESFAALLLMILYKSVLKSCARTISVLNSPLGNVKLFRS
jgi:hypothetical protein